MTEETKLGELWIKKTRATDAEPLHIPETMTDDAAE